MARVFPVLLNVGMMLILLIGSAAFPNNAHAASTITVTTAADNANTDGSCTLREAIANAGNNTLTFSDCIAGSGNDTIVFASSLGTATITLSSTLPPISDSAGLMIDGDNRITLSGNDSVRVLYVTGNLTLQNISVTHGYAGSGGGGGLYTEGSAVTIIHSTFSYNSAVGQGGGIYSASTMTVANSTFINNSATSAGGGIENIIGTLTIANSTFSNNSSSDGGGVENNSGTATILNSTFSNNSATSHGGGVSASRAATVTSPTTTIHNTILANSVADEDCWNDAAGSAILIGGNNIIESTSTCASIATITSDPNLGSLTGSPAYFPLNTGSPAIDAGNNAICAAAPVSNTSQNGVARPQGAHCDIGSYELMYKLFLPLLLR
jgi:CSLREA domain-containing protein